MVDTYWLGRSCLQLDGAIMMLHIAGAVLMIQACNVMQYMMMLAACSSMVVSWVLQCWL